MKLPTNKVEGSYACPCGCTVLNVNAKLAMVLKDGMLERAEAQTHDLQNAEIQCTVCNLRGPGYLFTKKSRSKADLIQLIVRYITTQPDKEITMDNVQAVLNSLLGVMLLVAEKSEEAKAGDTVLYDLHRDAPKPPVPEEEKKA